MKATKDSWKTTPMPEEREQLEVTRHYSAEEYERLSQGLIPKSQDDRWFVWVGDDHVVHVHRSWTGNELYRFKLVPAGDGYDIAEAWANRDPEQAADPHLDRSIVPAVLDELAHGSRV
jgi:hypothetical protein